MGCTQSSAAVGPSKSSSSGAGGSGRGGNVVVVQPAATDTSVAARNGGDIEGDVLEDSAFEPSLTASAPPGAAASRFVAMNGSLAGVVRPTLLFAPTTACHPWTPLLTSSLCLWCGGPAVSPQSDKEKRTLIAGVVQQTGGPPLVLKRKNEETSGPIEQALRRDASIGNIYGTMETMSKMKLVEGTQRDLADFCNDPAIDSSRSRGSAGAGQGSARR